MEDAYFHTYWKLVLYEKIIHYVKPNILIELFKPYCIANSQHNSQTFHFPVLKYDRDTTKCIVYDGASLHQGVALNDVISVGPKLQSELFDILIRFRHKTIAIACDISKMYLQIRIPVTDRPYFRFLWRDENEKIIAYEFERVCFGQSAAPAHLRLSPKRYRPSKPISTCCGNSTEIHIHG